MISVNGITDQDRPFSFGRSKLYAHSIPEETSGAFTAAEIAEANSHHDRAYGWTPFLSSCYTNLNRFPETVSGSIEDYWNRFNQRDVGGGFMAFGKPR